MNALALWIPYAICGIFAGMLAGLLGIGGGLIVVPFLIIFLPTIGVNPAHVMKIAIGTSLAVIAITATASVTTHHRHQAVLWPLFSQLLPGIILGAILGTTFAIYLPGTVLQRLFGIFVIVTAYLMASNFQTSPSTNLPGPSGLRCVGIILGCISSVLGTAGGIFVVPYLTYHRVPIHHAAATAAACGLPVAITGAISFMIMGSPTQTSLAWSTGYIYWPAFLGIASLTVFVAPIFAKLSHRLPAQKLKKIFALFLLVTAAKMLFF